jgi:hypothetical protein
MQVKTRPKPIIRRKEERVPMPSPVTADHKFTV